MGSKPWFTLIIAIVHAITGLLGIVAAIYVLYINPSSMAALFSNMLQFWLRTLFLALPYLGMILSTAFVMIGVPWIVYGEAKDKAQ